MKKATLTIVTPVYAGEKYLDILVKKIKDLGADLKCNDAPIELIEAIFVLDGAIDNSYKLLEELNKKYDWIRIITLSKNYGQHQASAAGILYSSGDWVATIDEDLQHDPNFILPMIATAIIGNKDIVYAVPIKPVHNSIARDWSSKFFKYMLSILSSNKRIKVFNSFRVIRGVVARSAAAVGSAEMYYDISLGWFTDSVTTYQLELIDTRYQTSKVSGYNFKKLLEHSRRLFVSAQSNITRVLSLMGFFSMLIGMLFILFIFGNALFDQYSEVPGWASIALLILFFGGLISLLIGVLLEYVAVIMSQSQGKPSFFVVDRWRDRHLKDWAAKLLK
jgi:glycosyltransferase involved in cell wall biosynthesis